MLPPCPAGVMHQMKHLTQIDPTAVTPVKSPQPSPVSPSLFGGATLVAIGTGSAHAGSLLSVTSSETSCSAGSGEVGGQDTDSSHSVSVTDGSASNVSGNLNHADEKDHGLAQM
ncbi:hypothetical protein DPMN_136241 [Dreissena polymorpha]|uniref:Uncharacterized protein n=1 Tax=Dreissena polymorpha TaxID=45954 RepID=A0A9D4FZM2_DREPO|nr:hypothetical protein DPMN_136241 [Dreissena polymorpha]